MTAAEPRRPARCRCVVEPVLDDAAPPEAAAEQVPPADLDAIRARHTAAALGLDVVARRELIHDVGVLLALVEQQAAEVERLRADRNRMHLALAQERHERAEAAEWPDVEQADRSVTVEIVPDPGGLLTALRATTGTRDAARAPESPANAATSRATPDA